MCSVLPVRSYMHTNTQHEFSFFLLFKVAENSKPHILAMNGNIMREQTTQAKLEADFASVRYAFQPTSLFLLI